MIWGHSILLIFCLFPSQWAYPSLHFLSYAIFDMSAPVTWPHSHCIFFRLLPEESNFLCKDLRAKRHPLSLHMQCLFLPQNETNKKKKQGMGLHNPPRQWDLQAVQFEANGPKGQEMAKLYARHSNTIQNGHVAFCCFTRQLSLRENCFIELAIQMSIFPFGWHWKSLQIPPNQLCSQKWCNASRLMKSQLAIMY